MRTKEIEVARCHRLLSPRNLCSLVSPMEADSLGDSLAVSGSKRLKSDIQGNTVRVSEESRVEAEGETFEEDVSDNDSDDASIGPYNRGRDKSVDVGRKGMSREKDVDLMVDEGSKEGLDAHNEIAMDTDLVGVDIILEPRIANVKANNVCRRIGLPNFFRVEAAGFSGGIWILWDSNLVELKILAHSSQLVHTMISGSDTNCMPWLVCGDFNRVMLSEEKMGNRSVIPNLCNQMVDCLSYCNLSTLETSSLTFTWWNKRSGAAFTKVRLDRAIANSKDDKGRRWFQHCKEMMDPDAMTEQNFNLAIKEILDHEVELPIASYCNEYGGWDFDQLLQIFPHHIVLRILTVQIDPSSVEEDVVYWRLTSSGIFSVKTAYDVQMEKETPTESFWDQLWRLPSPRKVRVFLWRLIHDSLPIADWLISRNLGSSTTCFRCGACMEDILHALKDCRSAKPFWSSCETRVIEDDFFCRNLKSWIFDNISITANYESLHWNIFFIHALWFLWYWRNLNKFDEYFRWPSNEWQ
ncbi:Uncharacterized protein TCM_001997 [Theobroma cacao]|uniref:Reverse transcriptase zinc-binding domain-containing protein n=1 Tax=Theobroma cacao TaxID=3641 RepID=A0A061DT78_THECC|nr:Uncharacterized protein TCM_001997 [Theobroma cacao]